MVYFIWSICGLNKQRFKRSIVARYWNQIADLPNFLLRMYTKGKLWIMNKTWNFNHVFPFLHSLYTHSQLTLPLFPSLKLRLVQRTAFSDQKQIIFSFNVCCSIQGCEINQKNYPRVVTLVSLFDLTQNSSTRKAVDTFFRGTLNFFLKHAAWSLAP